MRPLDNGRQMRLYVQLVQVGMNFSACNLQCSEWMKDKRSSTKLDDKVTGESLTDGNVCAWRPYYVGPAGRTLNDPIGKCTFSSPAAPGTYPGQDAQCAAGKVLYAPSVQKDGLQRITKCNDDDELKK